MITLTEEELQDWGAIYKINPMRSLSEVVKRQILLNKDWELAYFLKANEENMRKQGAKQYVNLDEYSAMGGAGSYTPSRVHDVLSAITPRISTLYSVIRRNFNMYPTYALTGLKTASHLRSLQEMVTNVPTLRGELGYTGAVGQFMKLKVIEAVNVDDNKIYLVSKAPNNSLEKASIVDFVYQPFYVVDEITDGINKRFARSRTLIDVFRTDGLGYLEVANIEKFVG